VSRTNSSGDSDGALAAQPIARDQLAAAVEQVLAATPVLDIHTHLFPAQFGELGLWGIDDLLTYHYLEAELFRSASIRPEEYWELNKTQQADLVWRTLFLENTPISEAARGVVAVLTSLGLDPGSRTLEPIREYFRQQCIEEYIPRVLALAGVEAVVMTNDPLDPPEACLWENGLNRDPQFHPALRLDRVLNEWNTHWDRLASQGYAVEVDAGGRTIAELRRFLADWIARMHPLYLAVSLPDSFQFPVTDLRTKLLREAVLPACQEGNLPLALMIGVRRQVNPALRLAGDAAGRADLRSLEFLCREYPENRFLVSVLSRENQHELCIYARKFRNLMPFGCWWFLNNPSIVEEITRERLEMLGTSFIPQHSDARILEQVIYKWRNTRRTIAPILTRTYQALVDDGRPVSADDMRRDAERLFRVNFQEWMHL